MKKLIIFCSAIGAAFALPAHAADLSAIQKAMAQATVCSQFLNDPNSAKVAKVRTSPAVKEVVASGVGLASLSPVERQQAEQLGKIAAACGAAIEAIDLAVKSFANVKLDPKEVPLVNGAHDAGQAIQTRLISDFF
jgi:hypothetical protein